LHLSFTTHPTDQQFSYGNRGFLGGAVTIFREPLELDLQGHVSTPLSYPEKLFGMVQKHEVFLNKGSNNTVAEARGAQSEVTSDTMRVATCDNRHNARIYPPLH
jgi:hypothetical protein